MKVRDVMTWNVVTISSDMPIMEARKIMDAHGIRRLPVVEKNKLVGIATTNDFFYKILNPVLGIGIEGTRIVISKGADIKSMQDILEAVKKNGAKILAFHSMPPVEGKEQDVCIHIDKKDAKQLVKDLASKNFSIEIIDR